MSIDMLAGMLRVLGGVGYDGYEQRDERHNIEQLHEGGASAYNARIKACLYKSGWGLAAVT